MTKLCLIITDLTTGGAEAMLLKLMQRIDRERFTPTVISLMGLGEIGPRIQALGIPVHALGMRRGGLPSPILLWRLWCLLRQTQPHIVQTWMTHSDLLGGLAAKLAGVPRVIWGIRTTDYSVESRSTRAVRWLCARLSYFVPDKIVCAAQASLASSAKAGYDTDKLMVIPNGFDVAALQAQLGTGAEVRKHCGFGASDVVVGCLGRYNPAKDHANFVRAAGLIAARHPVYRFLMVGRDLQKDNAELTALIEATGFADRFVLLGERADPAACLDAMDVFVLSSCTEGFPNVLGEAMAMAVPCVTTDVGDAAVLLGDAGEVVPARNAKALAEAVVRFLELPTIERKAMGHKGQERVQSQFSMDAAARRFADLYEEIMA